MENTALSQFETVQNPWGESLAHKTLPVWVVHYPMAHTGAYFQAYIATGKLIKGQHPCQGGVDNRRVGSDRGFQSAADAASAAIAKAGSAA
jgi:hypothetical protein